MNKEIVFDLIFLVSLVVCVAFVACDYHPATADTCEPTTLATTEETTEATEEPTETEVPTTEPPETTEATEPPTTEATEPPVILYNVPLEEDLQLYIIEQAESHGIDPAVVFAMIWKESRYHAESVGDNGNSIGLMQIQPRWHSGLMEQLGCNNLHNPYQNVTVGITILASHVDRYDGNIEMALVAYNAGASGANRNFFSKGVYSSSYSRSVMAKAEELRSDTYVFLQ